MTAVVGGDRQAPAAGVTEHYQQESQRYRGVIHGQIQVGYHLDGNFSYGDSIVVQDGFQLCR